MSILIHRGRIHLLALVGLLALSGCGNSGEGGGIWDQNKSWRAGVSGQESSQTPAPVVPRVAMDGQGNALVVWVKRGKLHERRFLDGAGWQRRSKIAEGVGEGFDLNVVADSLRGMVAWESMLAGEYRWHTLPVDLTTGAPGQPGARWGMDPHLATNTDGASGLVLGVWRGIVPVGGGNPIAVPHADSCLLGSSWAGTWQRLDSNNLTAIEPRTTLGLRAALDGSGEGFAIWSQDARVPPTWVRGIVVARGRGTAWSSADIIGRGTNTATLPDIAADAAGNAVAVWEQDDDLYAARYDVARRRWDPAAPVPDLLGRTDETRVPLRPDAPRVVLNRHGDGLAAWWAQDGRLYASRYSATGGWSITLPIDGDANGDRVASRGESLRPAVGIDADGSARVVWSGGGKVAMAFLDAAANAWLPAEEIGRGKHADVAMDASGRGVAAWWKNGLERMVWEPGGATEVTPPLTGSIAFASNRDGQFEVYTMDPDGSNVEQRTFHTADDTDPIWSPDGRMIAFISNRNDQPEPGYDLYVIDVSTRQVVRVTTDGDDGAIVRDPAWSPTGGWIAFSLAAGGGSGIALVTPEPPEVQTRKLLTTNEADMSPAWSPRGNVVVFSRNGDLYTVDPAGDETQTPVLLHAPAHEAQSPAWSPDGTRIAYAAAHEGGDEGIHALTLSGGQVAQVEPLTNRKDTSPCWSPDGNHLAFVWSGPEGQRIFTMTKEGDEQEQIPGQEMGYAQNAQPCWR